MRFLIIATLVFSALLWQSPTVAQAATTTASGSGTFFGLVPSCGKSGNCTVDDIVGAGVNFANFLLGLSGALFLAIFIYGGGMYLLSFGDAKRVKLGTDAIKNAAIGIVLVMEAWTIVRYVATTIAPAYFSEGAAGGSGQKKTCEQLGPGYRCMSFSGANGPEVQQQAAGAGFSCQTGYCPGDFHNICCK